MTNGESKFTGNQYFERLILWDRAQLAPSSPALWSTATLVESISSRSVVTRAAGDLLLILKEVTSRLTQHFPRATGRFQTQNGSC